MLLPKVEQRELKFLVPVAGDNKAGDRTSSKEYNPE
jgi:hypothetical protein